MEMIGNGMKSGGGTFSQQEMSIVIKIRICDCREHECTGSRRSRETKRIDERYLEWS